MELIFLMREKFRLQANITAAIYGIEDLSKLSTNNTNPNKRMKRDKKANQMVRRDSNLKQDVMSGGQGFLENCKEVDIAEVRSKSLQVVKTFKAIKQVIWESSISLDDKGQEIEKSMQIVDVKLLYGLLQEIEMMKELHKAGMTAGITPKRILKRFSLILSQKVESMLRKKV